jgi:hypothetical protein
MRPGPPRAAAAFHISSMPPRTVSTTLSSYTPTKASSAAHWYAAAEAAARPRVRVDQASAAAARVQPAGVMARC